MSTSTRRQFERLKSEFEQIKPKAPRPVRLVALPGQNASEAKRAAYAEAVAWSKAQGEGGINLIVLVGVVPSVSPSRTAPLSCTLPMKLR